MFNAPWKSPSNLILISHAMIPQSKSIYFDMNYLLFLLSYKLPSPVLFVWGFLNRSSGRLDQLTTRLETKHILVKNSAHSWQSVPGRQSRRMTIQYIQEMRTLRLKREATPFSLRTGSVISRFVLLVCLWDVQSWTPEKEDAVALETKNQPRWRKN